MIFTPNQIALIKSENPEIVFELNGLEVLAFYSLGQMHNKTVRMTDNFFGNTKVGLFVIEELNGNSNLDFSNPDDWMKVDIESVSISITSPNAWGGYDSSKFSSLLDIKSIALLKQ